MWSDGCRAGDVAYHGRRSDALSVFSSLGYTCQSFDNPADFLIDVIVDAEQSADRQIRDAIIENNRQRLTSMELRASGPDVQADKRDNAREDG